MNGELLSALDRIEREKGISKDILIEAIESALASAARKVIDDPEISKEDITVSVNPSTGEIEVYNDDVEVQSERFGRIAAQTAKQVIIQKIREAERDVIYGKYLKKVGTILSGAAHRFDRGNIIVDLGDTEAVLPKSEQIPREKFRQGEGIRAFLLKVEKSAGGPSIVLSRGDEGFVKKLFELEVPEISQGIVEIKAIAREVGERTKLAVYSKDEKIDPVGACVGMRGARVRDIVKELHGERIDVVRWNADIREYLVASVNPAEVTKLIIDRENNFITLILRKDQLSLVIGKKGRNIRLASKLLGWDLKVEAEEELQDVVLEEVKGITAKQNKTLREAEYETAGQVVNAGAPILKQLAGIGEKTAAGILQKCKDAMQVTPIEEKKDILKEKPEEAAEETPKAVTEEKPEEIPNEAPEDDPEEESIDNVEKESKDNAQEGSYEASEEASVDSEDKVIDEDKHIEKEDNTTEIKE